MWKDACYGVNISPDTCSRWRQKYPEFAERFMGHRKSSYGGQRTLSQNTTTTVLTSEGGGGCLPARQKPHSEALRGLQSYFAGGVGGGELDDDFVCEVF